MILDEVTGLVKYAGKRVLKQYQWKIVFEKSTMTPRMWIGGTKEFRT